MNVKTLFMETTAISPEKTAGDLLALLVACGASQISMEYANSKVVGMRFLLTVSGQPTVFMLPVRVEPVYQILAKRRSSPVYVSKETKEADRAKAERVAWRQIYRWTQAQLALIETGMVEAGEVFMPYMLTASGISAYQAICQGKLLEAPREAQHQQVKT